MMGSLARQDDYYDPMTGIPIGASQTADPPFDPRESTSDWARISGVHPQAFEPRGTQWPQYPPPPPKEAVPEDRPNPLIPFSAYRSKPPVHRAGDVAAQTIIEQGAGMLPGRLGGVIGSVLNPDDAEAARWIKYPFNRIAVGDTIGNLAKQNAYAPAKNIAERTIQPHDIPVGSWLTPLVGDRSRSGEFLTHIGEKELSDPVSLQGGYQFTPEWKDEGIAWASDRSPISTMGRRVREFQGRDVPGVYGVYTPMSTAVDRRLAPRQRRALADDETREGQHLQNRDREVRRQDGRQTSPVCTSEACRRTCAASRCRIATTSSRR